MRHRFAGGGGEQCRRLPTPVPAKTRAAVRLHQVVQAAQYNYTAFETIASGEYDKRRRKIEKSVYRSGPYCTSRPGACRAHASMANA